MDNDEYFLSTIYPIISEDDSSPTIQWMQENQLIKSSMLCVLCGENMEIIPDPHLEFKDGYLWKCPGGCRSSTHGNFLTFESYFFDSGIALKDWLFIIYLWGAGKSVNYSVEETNLSKVLVNMAYKGFRKVCENYFKENAVQIGGNGSTVITDYLFTSLQINGHEKLDRKWIYFMLDTSIEPNVGYLKLIDNADKSTTKSVENKYIDSESNIRRVNLNDKQVWEQLGAYWVKYEYLKGAMKTCKLKNLNSFICQIMWMDRFSNNAFKTMCDHIKAYFRR